MISQTQVNKICQDLTKLGEDISISKIKSLLGKGSHSTLTKMVLLYKDNQKKAIEVANTEKNNQKTI